MQRDADGRDLIVVRRRPRLSQNATGPNVTYSD